MHKRRLTSKSHSRTQFPNANHNLQMLATDTSVYLFILEASLCPFGRPVKSETKRERGGKIPSFLRRSERRARAAAAWTSAPSSGWQSRARTRTNKHSFTCTEPRSNSQTHTPISPSCSPLFSPGRSRVPQMCHQTLLSI